MIITLLVALGANGLGRGLFGRWTPGLDPAARLGLHGVLGLGFLGWITLPLGLLPGGFRWGVGVIGLLALGGLFLFAKERPRGALPKGPAALALLVFAVAGLVALVGVLAPSDSFDWDSLAYHLALPKVWLAQGQLGFISYDHHSNFPYVVDGLFVWGQLWGGQAGAKAFMLAYSAYGVFAVFGLARARYGAAAGWWSALAFATVPEVVWESGTAYVDVAHALFGGLGIWLAARLVESDLEAAESPRPASRWVLPALLLGGAIGSKYTALQTVAILGAVLLAYAFVKKAVKPVDVVKMGLAALAIGSPWYVKNVVWTHNPVYPFFYSKLGGVNWDAFQERIYSNEQQTFGVGRPMADDYTAGHLEPARIGGSVLGTAYEPGRFSNPAPTQGGGFPFVSLGAIPAAALLAWLLSGRARRTEGVCLAVALLSFAAWFVLSQQARYAFVWCVPLTILAGGAIVRLGAGRAMAGAVALQALLTLVVATRYGDLFAAKLRVVLGQESSEEYQARNLGFYEPAKYLNEIKAGRVALYDELFGYLLDVPYFWASPGHTTQLGYAGMETSGELVASLERQGITHVYVSLNLGIAFGGNREERDKWLAAAGLVESAPVPYADRAARMVDERSAVKVLLAEAIASGKLRLDKPFRSGMVFSVGG